MKSLTRQTAAVFAACTLATLAGAAGAQATTGSLVGWNVVGDVVSRSGAITLTTAFLDGAGDQAFNLSGHAAVDAGTVAGAAGLPVTALDLSGDNFATEGSLVAQSFAVAAGQTLRFDWSFVTQETLFLDHAFVVIGGQLFALATTANPGSGTQTFGYTFAKSGAVALSFGIVDTDDYDGVSALTVGNLQLVGSAAAVPEPATAALMLTGLGALGGVIGARRRRGRRAEG